ncbi:MAG: hypothetical protein GXX96_05085 [Planctomycetaceae bacterium]|nr:hypothetical protein [Planctomycetaceae bacterium]
MRRVAACFLAVTLTASAVPAAELYIGGATTSITPDKSVALDGHRNLRMSNKVESSVTATALALESREGDKVLDQAILVSCDIVAIRDGILEKIRDKVKPRLSDFDVMKLVANATHTHNAPVTQEGKYAIPDGDNIMKPTEYVEFMTDKLADAIVESWQNRRPGKVAWGQGQAVIAQNRRAVYANGTAKMYGATNTEDFHAIEGYEDHNLDVLFFWDEEGRLIATAINVPCPAQQAEGGLAIHADFWHPVREMLRQRHGKDLLVLGWIGAAGDQSPRPLYGKAADQRMYELRGLTRLEELARRIAGGWEDAYEGAGKDVRGDVVLRHRVEEIALPYRKVTDAEVAEARQEAAKYAGNPAQLWNYAWHQRVVDRHEAQQAGTEGDQKMELHVLRLGDVAIATNHFELYTDYGIRIKSRSPAIQTFIVQLACNAGGYLPSERAVGYGGYGAVIQSSRIGPEGGRMLVERSLAAIADLWSD